jgi:hypothetical protein
MTVTVTGAGRRIKFDWPLAARTWAEAVEPEATALTRARAPFFTGRLRQSIGSQIEETPGLTSVTIYGTVSYLPYVLDGTRAHVIAARNAKALRWMGKGGIGVNFARSVNHPGTKANPFPEEAMEVATPMIVSRFAAACREAVVVE